MTLKDDTPTNLEPARAASAPVDLHLGASYTPMEDRPTGSARIGGTSARDGRDLRVLFLSDHLALPSGITGATTYFTTVLPPLASAGVDLTVCFLRARHPVASELESAGVTPRFLDCGKWNPAAVGELRRIIRERDIHLVHAAGVKGILLGRYAAHLEGRKTIVHLHDLSPIGVLPRMLHRSTAHWTDLALVVSRAVAEVASTEFGIAEERVRVLHNGIPVARIDSHGSRRAQCVKETRASLGVGPASPLIGVIGRLVPEKGHLVLLQAMHQIVRTVPEAVLLIVGEGPLRPEIERGVRELGLATSVRMTGFRSDVPQLLAAIDVVTMPSLSEGLGFTALEAMAANRPVVASATGGLTEIVEHGESGLLVPPGVPGRLAEALIRVLRDPCLQERLVRGGATRLENFSMERHVAALVEEYRRLAFREAGHAA